MCIEIQKTEDRKVVIAIDSFKGSLSSIEAGNAAKEGILKACPSAEVKVCPLADGGEGTVEALVTGMGGEMAAAAGITLVPQEQRNPLYTTTYGVGELIRDAIGKGCRHFIIGIGGSSTNDGGMGMLQALGFSFQNKDGEEAGFGAIGLKDLAVVSRDHVLEELKECSFRIACDVTNPLCGEQGCSTIFGPQKGATPEMIKNMDQWLRQYAALAKKVFPEADEMYPGTGAAGGIDAFFSILPGVCTLEEAMEKETAKRNMADTAEQAMRLFLAERGKN